MRVDQEDAEEVSFKLKGGKGKIIVWGTGKNHLLSKITEGVNGSVKKPVETAAGGVGGIKAVLILVLMREAGE